ncbi:hypothetical protein FDUTEX481_07955 [Tolypothrix sp. PCC 7601]|nr:hypothetical protein FDUTEX481_07955 [Tolypothrix sp. PCC 7601]
MSENLVSSPSLTVNHLTITPLSPFPPRLGHSATMLLFAPLAVINTN